MLNISRRDFMKGIMIGGVAAGSAGLLAACGSSSSSSESSTSTDESSTAETTTENESNEVTESTGYVELTVGTAMSWTTMTPFRNATMDNIYYSRMTYETLGYKNADKEYEPWCAKSWVTEDGGYTYDIELYDYIYDTDGNNITAADIVWFIEEAKERALKPTFAKVDSVEQTGDYTLKVTMTSNIVGAFEFLLTNTFVVSQAAFEASSDEFATAVVTSSEYNLTGFVADSEAVFEKRDDYWQTDETLIPSGAKANVDKVTFKYNSEASQLAIMLETGEADIVLQLAASSASQYVDDKDITINYGSETDGRSYQIFFSGADTSIVSDDVNLCQAICYAINCDALIASVLDGYGETMHDVVGTTSIGYQDSWLEEEYFPYDVEKAEELLSESNYDGSTLTILCSTGFQKVGEVLQSQLGEIGIDVTLDLGDSAYISSMRLDGTKYDMFINTVSGVTLADFWSLRFDPEAYTTGDATSRHDYDLAELIYTAWTQDGWTSENINAVHEYIRDNGIAYGMMQPQVLDLYRNDINMTNIVVDEAGQLHFTACSYEGV